MSGRYETAIDVPLAPGFTLWTQVVVLHVVALSAALVLSTWPAVLAAAAVLGSGIRIRQQWRRSPWTRLFWRGWGGVEIIDRNGTRRFAELADRQFVTPWLVVLAVRYEEQILRFPIYRTDHPQVVRKLNQRLVAGRWRQYAAGETDERV